jgi:hypothetical protein
MGQDFARHFRQHVIPKLQKIALTQGAFLALDLIDYGDAYDTVWRVAMKLGVSRLSDGLIYDVRDWIDDEIWQAFEKSDANLQEYRRTIADPVWRDIQQWERKLARHLQQQGADTCQTTTTTA